jgi:D-alanine-D-alanine ligase
MTIGIITTSNEALKETGFATLKACNNVMDSIKRLGYSAGSMYVIRWEI